MSNSEFCIQQRHKQKQQIKKLLVFGFASSAVLHGILAYALPRISFKSAQSEKEPMELTLIDKPKPEPKVESKPIAKPEPTPAPKPEPVQAKTPAPAPKAPEPVKAQTPPPKPVSEPPTPAPEPAPAPKEVLTTPTPAPSQRIVSAPVANTAQSDSMSSSLSAANSSVAASSSSDSSVNGKPGGNGSVVAIGSAPPRPESNSEPEEGISCISNCEPEYPSALDGVEGSAGVKLTIDPNGNVISVELADADSNSLVNRQALLAARQMQFSSPGDSSASVQVKIDFTVEGSQYDRARREEQEQKEQAAREREEQEAAAQEQLEAQRQAQQEQLERERQAREQQQQAAPPPTPEATPEATPALSPAELEEERLRKFKERMENYQEE